eukprot:TRINITY_DN506_c0_g1_i2.p1 TRINITY_DN506_c0_g1~~TRINITY_DN506_c0_g1_i2.p1  ORF type:complete len:166 (-),score=17.27 TRINITY_DN506_c0_g1_i2:71-568(-)
MSVPPPPPPLGVAGSSWRSQKKTCTPQTIEKGWKELYPLHFQAQMGNPTHEVYERCKKDASEYIDVNSFDDDGWCPIHYASWYGHEQVVQKLLTELGANVNAQTRETVSTPLHFAAGCGHQPIVRLLLCHQANHSLQDKDKKTARDICSDLKPTSYEQILLLLSK